MLIRRSPFNMIDRILDEASRNLGEVSGDMNFAIALDVHESEENYTINADMPGLKEEDIDIRLHDNILTISAENNYENKEENGNTIIQERRYGKFSRSLRFPVNVNSDAIEADFDNGVLTVTVPKAEEVKPRRIEVKKR